MTTQLEPQATFTDMKSCTAEDWQRIGVASRGFSERLPERILAHLRLLDGDYGGFMVDRLTHSLQTATRAARANRSDEYVACALVHDIGDTLASYNHADLAAAIVKPFVSPELHWMVEHHGIFQGYYFFHHIGLDPHMRDRFAGHPQFDLTAEFCADFDAPAFDPAAPTMSLEEFAPLLHSVFAAPKRSIYLPDSSSAPN